MPTEERTRWVWLGMLAAAAAAMHVATNGAYGLHRDELQVLDDARHLAWGFVAYPPLTPAVERLGMAVFGSSLVGLRLFSVLAQAGVIVLAGALAAEFGGGGLAQLTAAVAVAVSPLPMFEATEFQYTSFEMLWWLALAYCVARLLRSGNGRWWIPAGLFAGLGMMTKWTVAFGLAGLALGLVLTPSRRYFKSRWLWCGAGLAFVVFLPNLLWQVQHGWVTVHFLAHIHARDVSEGRAQAFWRFQAAVNVEIFALPLALAGVWFLLLSSRGKQFRALAWSYLLPLAAMWLAQGRGYYVGAAYPMLLAAGGGEWERLLARFRPGWRQALAASAFALLLAGGVLSAHVVLPWQPLAASDYAIRENGDLREEVGWRALAGETARIWNSLPPSQRSQTAIVTWNYGETGAIDWYGPALGLPAAISGVNTAWYRGYGDPPPQWLLVLGLSPDQAEEMYQGCQLAGRDGNPYGIHNEESDQHPNIFLCGPPRAGWAEYWADHRGFG
ncbi:MAG TPA: glycosyltransferase family 39 protein [Candidatus Sulfopaludibacter sp.]|nr:glycosyltransferase family 39 protein [Candidatus Sulfopaludibacter sp.]